MRILIVEDDADIATNLYDYLAARGHVVDAAPNGLVALHLLAGSLSFDAIVLDLGLPGMDGLTVAERLRRDARLATPILMLTARDTLDDKLAGFDAGANDYLVKPFALKEVEVRLAALVKRAKGRVVDTGLRLGALEYDARSGIALWYGEALPLPPKALQLLIAMLTRPGQWLRDPAQAEESPSLPLGLGGVRRLYAAPDAVCGLVGRHRA
ncbi:response regulator transcription factor [Chitinolyticbacter albus]|uniref:response regulator transcription factor n=1 Tax=Chitinolyticbacter albus TaxID=2961951 RepID=UPI00210C4A78|nr:response regulator transcription factor [Chitinolyticbacter albus]